MIKYLAVFTLSWQEEFTYRLNFILWRFRNVLRFLMLYFLWYGIFLSNKNAFGYSQTEMFTYVFLTLFVTTIVGSAPSGEKIGGEIARGDLSNYLLKPIDYLKYWFVRDLSSKFLNLSFAFFELSILWLVLKPEIKLPSNPSNLFFFFSSLILAIFIFYFLNVITKFTAFWRPEDTWGATFLMMVSSETLAGGIFPLDILPAVIQSILQLTPFPYLIYFPNVIFLEKLSGVESFRIILQSFIWTILLFLLTKHLWKKGLKNYSSEGR